MKKTIARWDGMEAFLSAISIMEIEGDNKMIEGIQHDVWKRMKEQYTGGLDLDWVYLLVQEVKKREQSINNK